MRNTISVQVPADLLSLLRKIYHVPSTSALLGISQEGKTVLLNLWNRSVVCNDWNMLHVMLSSLLYFTTHPNHSRGVPAFVRIVGNPPHPWQNLRVSPRHFDHLKSLILRELGKTMQKISEKMRPGCQFPIVVIDSDNTSVLDGAVALSGLGVCIVTTQNINLSGTITTIVYHDGFYSIIDPETENNDECRNVFLPQFKTRDIANIVTDYLNLERILQRGRV